MGARPQRETGSGAANGLRFARKTAADRAATETCQDIAFAAATSHIISFDALAKGATSATGAAGADHDGGGRSRAGNSIILGLVLVLEFRGDGERGHKSVASSL